MTPIKGRLGKTQLPHRETQKSLSKGVRGTPSKTAEHRASILCKLHPHIMESRIFKNVGHRGNITPIYRESARRLTQPFQIPHKSALTAVRTFSRTERHTKRFLSRSGSPQKFLERGKPHEASLHTKRLSPQGVFSHKAVLHTSPPGHSAMSPAAHLDELLHPAQATTPQELD